MTTTTTPDRTAVRLSEPVRVTLSVEGLAPLRVELPPDVVDEPSAAVWRVRPDGPSAVTDRPNGRQRWSRTFRADPYQPGNPLRLGFAPAKASAGDDARPVEVSFQAIEIRVTTDITDPSAATIRPITGIEELPPVAVEETGVPKWAGVAVVAVGVLSAVFFGRKLRRRRSVPLLSPDEQVRLELDEAEAALGIRRPPAEVAGRVSAALRRFLTARFAVPAERLTTAELVATGAWPPEVAAVLEACDRAKFADRPATADGIAEIVRQARQAVSVLGERPT